LCQLFDPILFFTSSFILLIDREKKRSSRSYNFLYSSLFFASRLLHITSLCFELIKKSLNNTSLLNKNAYYSSNRKSFYQENIWKPLESNSLIDNNRWRCSNSTSLLKKYACCSSNRKSFYRKNIWEFLESNSLTDKNRWRCSNNTSLGTKNKCRSLNSQLLRKKNTWQALKYDSIVSKKIDKVEFCSHWVLSPQVGTHRWRKR